MEMTKNIPMIKNNFHTHVQRCRHASGTEEDYIASALQSGLTQLGFSDHAPFPDIDFGRRMLYCELQDYLDAVDTMKTRYHGKLTIWKGLEIEYLPSYRGYYEELLTKRGLDYLLMGEHFYIDTNGQRANVYEISSSTKEYTAYARTVAEGMRTGFFKAVAHPDLYLLNPFAWNDDCRRAADLILDTAAATGTILEYNANGLRWEQRTYPDGVRPPYPHETFWQMAAETSVKVIVGSDCHNPAHLWDSAMEQAYRTLDRLGITPVTELMGGTSGRQTV